MKSIQEVLNQGETLRKEGKPNSERSFYIQEIADLTGMSWKVIFGKCNHLVGVKGTEILQQIYLDSLEASKDSKWRRIKFWKLLKETKVE